MIPLNPMEPWMATETLAELKLLVSRVQHLRGDFVRLVGFSMISASARTISSQHASWGHIADNVRPREFRIQSVTAAAARWLSRSKKFFSQPLQRTSVHGDQRHLAAVHKRDWSTDTLPGPGSIDLLLTSPPYADAIDYTLAQRLSLYFLGYDDEVIKQLVAHEIGARRKRFKADSRSNWSRQLCVALESQVTWLRPGGTVCLVLPHKESGRRSGEEELRTTLEALGWRLLFERDRSIHQAHTRQSWTSIKRETILVFSSP